jgi:hypothetical protein
MNLKPTIDNVRNGLKSAEITPEIRGILSEIKDIADSLLKNDTASVESKLTGWEDVNKTLQVAEALANYKQKQVRIGKVINTMIGLIQLASVFAPALNSVASVAEVFKPAKKKRGN